jgi:hypothetical protein
MAAVLALSFVLIGAPGDDATGSAPPSASSMPAALTPGEARLLVRAGLADAARIARTDRQAAARGLLPLYERLRDDDQLPEGTRRRHLRSVGVRLTRLAREIARLDRRDRPGGAASASAASHDASPHAAAGGRPQRDTGWQLVELIQNTVSPDHWDVNGGPGSIFYYAPLRVLVVRASGSGHEGVGDALGGLRGR